MSQAPIQTTAGTLLVVPRHLIATYAALDWDAALRRAADDQPHVQILHGNEYTPGASLPDTALLHRIKSAKGDLPGLLKQNW